MVWAAGVKGSPLGAALAGAAGAELDAAGRVKVLADFSLPGHPELFVIGDLAAYETTPGRTLPGVAQPALQGGAYVARLIRARLRGRKPPAFHYNDRGSMATVGRNAAIADVRGFRFSGFTACAMWMFIHLLFIEQCHNRVLVLAQWLRSYFTGARSARLIEGPAGDGQLAGPVVPPRSNGAHRGPELSGPRGAFAARRHRVGCERGPGMSDGLLWHRIQFAFTVTYHYLFPQLTMGLALLIVIFKVLGAATSAKSRTTRSRGSGRGSSRSISPWAS